MAKVMKLLDAYDALMKNMNECSAYIQTDLELMTDYARPALKYKTKDGKVITDSYAYWSAGCMYYYNYINNNTGYYSIEKWIKNYDNQRDLANEAFGYINAGESANTNDCIMYEAPALIKWFKQAKSIKGYDFTETDEYTISGIKSSYIIKLNVDGDKTCTAVFDKDDNLLNICTGELFDENNYIPSNILN